MPTSAAASIVSSEPHILPSVPRTIPSATGTRQEVEADVFPTGWPDSPTAWNWPQPAPETQSTHLNKCHLQHHNEQTEQSNKLLIEFKVTFINSNRTS